MPNYTNLNNNILIDNTSGIQLYPSHSQYNPTSSAPATAAEVEIRVSNDLNSNLISDTTKNPFIRIPIISSSNVDGNFDHEIVLRFFTGSHFFDANTSSIFTDGGGNDTKLPFRSLYYTGSENQVLFFRDTLISRSIGKVDLRNRIHDLITGSNFHVNGAISASKKGNLTASITYNGARGKITAPIEFTGSFSAGEVFKVVQSTAGTGNLNFSENTRVLSPDSASFKLKFDDNDNTSVLFESGEAAIGYQNTSRANNTLLYFSSSGHVGVGTKNPKAKLDISGSTVVKKIKTVSTGSTGRSIILEGDRVKFFENTEQNPDSPIYDIDKEKARIRAVEGSYNLIMEVSGSSGYTKSFFISQSGEIGFNTDKPTSGFDVLANESTFQKPGSRKGLKINEFGDIESFNRDLASAATGSEILLKYSRGVAINQEFIASVFGASVASDGAAETFFNNLGTEEQNEGLQRAEELGLIVPPSVGDVLGSIRFIAESGSINDLDERTSGEAASIQSKVHTVGEGGVRGDLIFNVADQTGASVQRFVLDAGDNHQLSGSLIVGGTNASSATIKMLGTGGNNQAGFFRVGSSTADLKIGRMLLFDDGTEKVQISGKGKSFIAGTSGTGTTGTFLGINNTDPLHTLSVTGDITASGFLKIDGNITASGNISASGTGSFESIAIPGNSTDYYIGGSGGGVASNTLRIGSKTVGNTIALELFHTANPVSLGVSYSGGDALAFVDSVHSTFDSVLQFKTGGSERFRIGALDADTFQIKPASPGNDIQITDDSGNAILYSDTITQRIGIGTTSPGEKLEVVGNISASGNIEATSFTGSFSGTITGDATGLTGTPDISVRHITASGNISASGNLIANQITSSGNLLSNGNLTISNPNPNLQINDTNGRAVNIDVQGNTFRIDDVGNNAALFTTDLSTNPPTTTRFDNITFIRDVNMSADLTVGGTLTAQEFHTEFISASILFESGSTKFGDTLDDVHNMTGSLLVTGSATFDIGGRDFKIDNISGFPRIFGDNSLFIAAGSNIQIQDTFIPHADSSIPLGASNRFWSELYVDEAKIGNDQSHNHVVSGSLTLTGSQQLVGTSSLTISSHGKLQLGGTNDFWVYHDGTDSQIINRSSGDLIISSQVTNSDLMLKNVAGGGVTNYIVLDGGEEKSIFYRPTRHRDNVTASFGNSDDLQIYHDGSNSYIDDTGTGNLVIRALTQVVFQKYTGETLFKGITDGAFEAYHNHHLSQIQCLLHKIASFNPLILI